MAAGRLAIDGKHPIGSRGSWKWPVVQWFYMVFGKAFWFGKTQVVSVFARNGSALPRDVWAGWISSSIVHMAALVLVHVAFRGGLPIYWPGQQGVSSVASSAAIQLTAAFEPAAASPSSAVQLSEASAERNEGGDLTPTPVAVLRSAATPTLPEPVATQPPEESALASEADAELFRASQFDADARNRFSETDSPSQPTLPRRTVSQPPRTASAASAASAFSTGQAEKSPFPSYSPSPVFPPELLARRQSGVVILRVEIDSTGRVTQCVVRQSSGFAAFDRAALEAVRQWRFEPAQNFGRPVAARVDVPIRFQYSDLP